MKIITLITMQSMEESSIGSKGGGVDGYVSPNTLLVKWKLKFIGNVSLFLGPSEPIPILHPPWPLD
jgi:hypothetical protein